MLKKTIMKKKIAIYCDLNDSSGLGHLSRMKNLSQELEKKGSECYFFFNEINKNYILKYVKNLRIILFSNKKKIESIKNALSKDNFSILIIDSYENNLYLEKTLVKKGFFVVSIDDHLRDHFSNIVVNNRFEESNSYNKISNQVWLTGSKYILITGKVKKTKEVKHKLKKLKLLLHAGGSSSFKDIKKFTEEAFVAINKYDLNASILCTSSISKKYITTIAKKYNNFNRIKILSFTKNLSDKIKNYDLIAGPAGTTTFESIMVGVVPYSVPIKNDGRDSVSSWNALGHLAHLSNAEKNNKVILRDMWSLIIKNYHQLLNLLNKNSKQLDGLGPRRLAEKIIFYYERNYKKLKNRDIVKKKDLILSKECKIFDIRHFLNARNQKLVRAMSTTSRIITWPEHINWWLRSDVKKYKLMKGDETVAYHWTKNNKDSEGKFVTSAWFLSKDTPNKLQIAYEVLRFQCKFVKKNYKNSTWIITMKEQNKFVQRLNSRFGFYPANQNSIFRVLYAFTKFKSKMSVMEMKV